MNTPDIFPAYQAAQELVCAGRLRIIHIDAPPRSISSAFQIALTQGADGHLYEPFRRHGHRSALEATSSDLLTLYEKVKENRGAGQEEKPVTLTVKELSQFLKEQDFAGWLPLVSGWVSIVRSPNTQMQSFMTRSIFNGNHFSGQQISEVREALAVQNGKPPSEQEIVYALSEQLRVKRGKRTPADVVLPHQLETPKFDMWGALSRHYAELRTRDIPQVVVDGTVLCAQPEQVMRGVADKLGLTFSPSMLLGWKIASGKKLIPEIPPDNLKNDAWLMDAVGTNSLMPPHNQPLPLSKFAPSVQRYVGKALEYFTDFVNSPCAVLPRHSEDVKTLFSTEVPEGAPFGTNRVNRAASTFDECQPIAAYAVALSMPAADEATQKFKDGLLVELEELHRGCYGDSFQIMQSRQRLIDAARQHGPEPKPC